MTEEIQSDFLGHVILKISPVLWRIYLRYRTLVNYLVAGGSAAFINLATLYVLTDLFKIWYLASAVVSFLLAFLASFYLQKHWTFRDHSREGVQAQMTLYFVVALVNLVINTALMYFLVDVVRIWYMLSQVLTSAMIAVESFFVYRTFIFASK